jgi:hypothetical protein
MMPALYDYKVEIEGNSGFILDTDLLDTGLLGYLTTDVTQYVRNVSVRRGKSTNLDEFTAGQMTVVFDNRSRAFDPNYTSSPYYGSIVPRRIMRFSIAEKGSSSYGQVFEGFVDDWNFNYDVSGDSIATASCSDAFTVLANQIITLTSPASELAQDRIQRVLTNSAVNYRNDYATSGSVFTMNSVSYTGNALAYIQDVANSERGYFFIAQGGDAFYLGWNWFVLGIDGLVFTDVDDGSGVPYTSIETTYGTEQLYNYVTVTGSAGTVTAQDVTSQINYGIAAESFPVVTAGTAEMQVLANYIISNYSDPRFRVSEVTISLDDPKVKSAFSNQGLTAVIRHEIGYQVQVIYTPNQIGTAVSRQGFVIGKSINASPEGCTISFSISSNDFRTVYP